MASSLSRARTAAAILAAAQARLRAWNRIIEQHQHAVADEAFERAFELVDQSAQRGVILLENGHYLLWLGGLRERREAAQIAEDDRNLATMAFQRLHGR